MNVLVFTGNLEGPSSASVSNDKHLISFTVKSDVGFGRDKAVQKIDCLVAGTHAMPIMKCLRKGTLVGVTGEVRIEERETEAGEKDLRLSVMVMDLEILSGSPVKLLPRYRYC